MSYLIYDDISMANGDNRWKENVSYTNAAAMETAEKHVVP